MDKSSRVGVVDKTAAILDALELRPRSLGELVEATGIARPTAHRLAVALADHGLVARDAEGRFLLGPRIPELAAASTTGDLALRARPVLRALRDSAGESTQLYQRSGQRRICVAVADLPSGLRDTVPLGASLAMTAGSAAQVLLAWDESAAADLLSQAAFSADTLALVRRRGWAASSGEREPGVASVSAPVRAPSGRVVAALSISGPVERFGPTPGERFAEAVTGSAARLTAQLADRSAG